MLSITTKELKRHIRRRLGFSDADLTDSELDAIDDIMRQGLRWFYFGDGYAWSFLRAYTSLTFTTAKPDQDLPEDFVRIDSPVNLSGGRFPLEQVTSEVLQSSRDNENRTGAPVRYAIQSRPPNHDTLYRMGIYPIESTVTLNFWYLFDPPFPTDGIAPRGGAAHADTIIAACIAAGEQILNPEGDQVQPTWEYYAAKRAESISKDSLLKGSAQ